MPIYDYRCDHCGHAFSVVQSYKDEPLEKCPNCGKRPRRLIVLPAIVFKGSGWYKTDSRPAEKSDSKSESKADAKTDSKTDAKIDAKTDAKANTKTASKTESKAAEKSSPKSEASS